MVYLGEAYSCMVMNWCWLARGRTKVVGTIDMLSLWFIFPTQLGYVAKTGIIELFSAD